MKKINIYDLKTSVEYLKLQIPRLSTGIGTEKYNVSEQKEVIDDTSYLLYPFNTRLTSPNSQDKKYATVGFQPTHKKKIWIDKLNISEINSHITELSKILDRELISGEKDLKPYSTLESVEISKKLWLPTKIDCVDSVLTSSFTSSKDAPMGKSWFSINEKHPRNKSSLMTSFQFSQYSLPNSMDSGAIRSKKKLEQLKLKEEKKVTMEKFKLVLQQIMKTNENEKEKKIRKEKGRTASDPLLKTLKFRIFPTPEEIKLLQVGFDQYRWYYNATLNIAYKHYGFEKILNRKKYSDIELRDLVRKYKYVEKDTEHFKFIDFEYDEKRNEVPIPPWWNEILSARIPRGASSKFVSSLNSAITNFKEGNTKKPKMSFMSKKKDTEYMYFEDRSFPLWIKKIKSTYWIRTKDHKRKTISLSDLPPLRSAEIIYDKIKNQYFLHTPVQADWFHDEDRRIESQERLLESTDRIIALDPGVRKFLVGYDPQGKSVFFGEGASLILTGLLLELDKETDNTKQKRLWNTVKHYVEELHWKTASYLVNNYDIILLPEFRVQGMIQSKEMRYKKMTKRLLSMFSYYKFRMKLNFKCAQYKKKLIIVDESFTSRTCTGCQQLGERNGEEEHRCLSCGLVIDRDVAGSRNILIKNLIIQVYAGPVPIV